MSGSNELRHQRAVITEMFGDRAAQLAENCAQLTARIEGLETQLKERDQTIAAQQTEIRQLKNDAGQPPPDQEKPSHAV